MDDALRVERSRTFGSVADVYQRTRPGYPAAAVRWLVGSRAQRVLELGAGTGKLTAALDAVGHEVVATDPSGPMLARLPAGLEARPVRCGAEELPFRAATFDVVVAAQAFHWFDPRRALPEIARVLRAGGRLALVWNFRDESVPWVRRLSDLIGTEHDDRDLPLDSLGASGLFGELASTEHRCWQQLDRESLQGLVRSRSYVASLDEAERSRLLDRVGALYDDYARTDGLRLPYRTHCYRTKVVKDPGDAQPPDGETPLFALR